MANVQDNTFFQGAVSKQKQKLLILRNIMIKETDENNSLTVVDIINKLAGYGVKAERKTVYDDIATLQANNIDIVCEKKGHSNAYYVASRDFQEEELFILADAISSSVFLTKKKSDELIEKLKNLTSKEKSTQLSRNVYIANRAKSYNETIYYSINKIHKGIKENKKIEFKYLEYSITKTVRLKNNGEVYVVSPLYLVWTNDKYYLVAYSDKHEKICNYRVDRMTEVANLSEKSIKLTKDDEDMAKRQRRIYDMYGGEEKDITILMDNSLISVIMDKFGQNVNITKFDDNSFEVRVSVEVSPTFWGWLFTFGDKAKVISPNEMIEEAKKQLKGIEKLYE